MEEQGLKIVTSLQQYPYGKEKVRQQMVQIPMQKFALTTWKISVNMEKNVMSITQHHAETLQQINATEVSSADLSIRKEVRKPFPTNLMWK